MALADGQKREWRRRWSGQCRAELARPRALRKHAVVLIDDVLRRLVQVAGAGVVTKPGPQVQHLILWAAARLAISGNRAMKRS